MRPTKCPKGSNGCLCSVCASSVLCPRLGRERGAWRTLVWSVLPFGGLEGLVSGDSAQGHRSLGVAAAAVQLILAVTKETETRQPGKW